MKIWTSCQNALEAKVISYKNDLSRYEEKCSIEHQASCGELIIEKKAEIEAYKNMKGFYSLSQIEAVLNKYSADPEWIKKVLAEF